MGTAKDKDDDFASLVLEGVQQIHEDQVPLAVFIKIAMELEKNAAQVAALCNAVQDGKLYGLEKNGVKNARDYAFLMHTLMTLKESGKRVMEFASSAIVGTDEKLGKDGHAQRFAELLQEQGMQKVSFDEVGTCYISSSVKAMPPGKGSPDYETFRQWCKDKGITQESYQWQSLQKLAEDEQAKGTLPAYIKVSPRLEVRLRRS